MELEERRLEVIRGMEKLEKDRDRETNKLRRLTKQELYMQNFFLIQDSLVTVLNLDQQLIQRVSDWEDLLEQNEEGDVIFPARRELDAHYAPDNAAFKEKRTKVKEVRDAAELAISLFFVSLPSDQQHTVRNQARIPHLQDLTQAKLTIARHQIAEEGDTNTVPVVENDT